MSKTKSTNGYRDSAPAYQEYASDMLANRDFRLMSLSERGLLYTLRLECWHSNSIPADPEKLARLLGILRAALEESLTPSVLGFMTRTQKGQLEFPDLEQYRHSLADRRGRQAEAARQTNKKIAQKKLAQSMPCDQESATIIGAKTATVTDTVTATRTDTITDPVLSGVEPKGVEWSGRPFSSQEIESLTQSVRTNSAKAVTADGEIIELAESGCEPRSVPVSSHLDSKPHTCSAGENVDLDGNQGWNA